MKHLVLIPLLAATTAFAGEVSGTVEDHYRTVTRQIPHSQQVCQDVQVPVVRQQGPDTGAVLLGGIVGNAIGAATGIGDARTLGTVIGGIAGAEMSRGNSVDHYRIEQRCSVQTTYTQDTQQVYSHSTITFYDNGRRHTVRFQR